MFFCLKIVQDLQKMCALLSNESPCELNINQKHDILNQYFQNQMARARWFWDSYLDFTEFSEMQALKMETSVTTEKLIGILWKWAFRTTYVSELWRARCSASKAELLQFCVMWYFSRIFIQNSLFFSTTLMELVSFFTLTSLSERIICEAGCSSCS